MTKLSAKKIASNVAYNQRQDAIMIRPSKEIGQKIRSAAQAAGQPLQRWIIDRLLAAIQDDDKRI